MVKSVVRVRYKCQIRIRHKTTSMVKNRCFISFHTTTTPMFQPSSHLSAICSYWRNHPGIIWGLLGWWGTLGSAFGGASSVPGFGASMSLPQALSNTRADGLGALYREGTASFLNSLVNDKFPYTTKQVRDRFVASLGSNKAAAAQAHLFRMANEGRMKSRDWSVFGLICVCFYSWNESILFLRIQVVCGV